MRRSCLVALVSSSLALALARALAAQPEPLPSDVSFSLKRSFLEELMTAGPDSHSVGARWSPSLRMGQHSKVHVIASDCELHVAAKLPNNRIVADPPGIVVEPPNICKRRVPIIRQTGGIAAAWTSFFDNSVKNQTCDVTGFPRLFTEHASSGEGASNPFHVVEIHPAVSLDCGGTAVDFLPNLRVFPGMSRIKDNSVLVCLGTRKLYVRQRGSGAQIRYEFLEEGGRGSGGSCGNFAVVDAHITKAYLRELSNGGDHVALARVFVGSTGPYPLKVYTYKGTAEDDSIAALIADPDSSAQLELPLHGLFTYDYFTIVQALQDDQSQWLPPTELRDYKEVRYPLALIIFGRGAP